MSQKIKSIAEAGMQPTYFFEVGKRYPFPRGKHITDIIDHSENDDKIFNIYNEDGLAASMINCPVVIVYEQKGEN